MFDLDNITVQQLFQLKDEELFLKYMRFGNDQDGFYLAPAGTFARSEATPLGQLTFGQVAQIKHNLTNSTFESIYECFEIVFRVKKQKYLQQDVVSFFRALNWITSSLKDLIQKEQETFGGETDPLLEMAGVNRLAAFGELNTLKAIGKQFAKSPAEVENWKYNLVFALMIHDKVSQEVEKNYHELKANETKTKA